MRTAFQPVLMQPIVAKPIVTQTVDEEEQEDWCAPAQRRVADGSDGLWVRCGPDEDEESCMAAWFSLRFNPCVSCGATVLLLGIVLLCMLWAPGNYCWKQSTTGNSTYLVEETCYVPGIVFSGWQSWITKAFTWLYIGTQDVWIIFIVVVYFSKYADMKLGHDDDVPEFSTLQWFAMVFSCGVGTGLFYFGVAEPVWHYTGDNRWKDLPQNKRAQEAMNTTFYHWGVHGWVCYAILGVLLAILHFRKGLPMTIKSCFYPLLGMNIYGFWGDLLDTVSVVSTTMGVCTSLGLGVIQLNTGIERLLGYQHWVGLPYFNANNADEWSNRPDLLSTYNAWPNHLKVEHPWFLKDGNVSLATQGHVADVISENNQQILLIWIITGLATCSVMLGLKTGIATLASICLWLGMFLMVFVLLMDDTYFLVNLFVQSLGFYVQWLWEIGWHTGAFSQSEHGDVNGEDQGWMGEWTIFYWGWWIAWAPFVGVFLARVSKGRTVREFINGTIIIPVLYNFAWMVIFGGAGLKMQILAEQAGVKCNMNIGPSGEVIPGLAPYSRNVCRNVDTNEFTTEGVLFCSTVSNLSCTSSENMLFDLLMQYGDLGYILCAFAMFSLVLYFVTSSDSGSMVDDMMTANGIPEPPLLQRLYWALTEGLAATALLYAGRYIGTTTGGLKALQTGSICVGLPYTFLVCFMCVSLWRTFQYEFKDRQWHDGFKYSLVDVGVTLYTALPGRDRCCNWGSPVFISKRLGKLVMYIFFPFMGFWPAARGLETRIKSKKDGSLCAAGMLTAGAMVLFYAAILFWFLDFIPTSGAPITFGSELGSTPTYLVSSRYGKFRAWNSIPSGTGPINICNLTQGLSFVEANNELPFDSGAGCAPHGVGERIGGNGAYYSISCFLFFAFVTCVMFLRFDVRENCGIPGSIVEDFFVAFIWPSTIYQCEKQVEEEAGDSDSDKIAYETDSDEEGSDVSMN